MTPYDYAAEFIPYWRRQARQFRARAAHPESHLPIESVSVFKRNAMEAGAIADQLEDELLALMEVQPR